ncbi:hypothetical protein TIFTF001_018290 [Ficus carica]|uniref:Uncharacterized protein n=1 Tax=Ficus carica TaxID=3494 RepID=A0AA88ART7_FICCA|nr:hypothetical protein TIFTF001_018290 [Ficus carica]
MLVYQFSQKFKLLGGEPIIVLYFNNYALNAHNREPSYTAEIFEKLKKSLSQALTLYYPLAGRFLDDPFLDCNDDGVPFFEARVNTKFSDVLENTILLEINKLLPLELDEIAELPFGIQLNIEALRAKYKERTSEGGINNHTVQKRRLSRIAVISAFLWSSFIAAKNSVESEAGKNYEILHPVNNRPRCHPPLAEHSFGNYYTTSTTTGSITSTCTGEEYCYNRARKIGEEIRRIDKNFVAVNIQEKGDEMLEKFQESSAARGLRDLVALFDNKSGDGIEAYICLKPDDMTKLEVDKEFIAFVSPNIAALGENITNNISFVNGV